MRRDLPG